MIAIALRFPAGRFHATAWGRHVNEAVPEWPPSPWRLLRGFVATWKRKLDDELTQSNVEPVLHLLAEPPKFVLPPAALGHSRHFMPWFKKGPDDRTLVFDAFVALDRSTPVTVVWPGASLGEDQRHTLSRLLENLGFLGRAESWCDAQLLSADETIQHEVNCSPLDGQDKQDQGEVVRVLCADPVTAFSEEPAVMLEERKAGRYKGGSENVHPRYDPNWHLCIETGQLHAERWSDPPGARWVRYVRPSDCFKIAPLRSVPVSSAPRPQVARFALDSTVLPLVTDTLPIAEAARYVLMGIYGRLSAAPDGSKGKSRIFSGKDVEGFPLTRHEHAYYLPTDEDADGKLDHLTIVATDGFGAKEVQALDRLREVKSREREKAGDPLRVVLLAVGSLEKNRPLPLGSATEWVSATPFIVTRHLKRRGVKRDPVELWEDRTQFIATVLREELARWLARSPEFGNIRSESVEISPSVDEQGAFRIGARGLRPIQFKRFRQKRGDDGGRRMAGAFHLTFPRPVLGPICLGHSAHFGMGLFVPIAERERSGTGE